MTDQETVQEKYRNALIAIREQLADGMNRHCWDEAYSIAVEALKEPKAKREIEVKPADPRRYEIAKDILVAWASGKGGYSISDAVIIAVKTADALIAELDKEAAK